MESTLPISLLARQRIIELQDELLSYGLTARVALEKKFFLVKNGKKLRVSAQQLDSEMDKPSCMRVKSQVSASPGEWFGWQDYSMYEANFDLPHLGYDERLQTPVKIADSAVEFISTAQERIDALANSTMPELAGAKVEMRPLPFGRSYIPGWNDVNSMHVNISLQNRHGKNLFTKYLRLMVFCEAELVKAHSAGILALSPSAESFERLGANYSTTGKRSSNYFAEEHCKFAKMLFSISQNLPDGPVGNHVNFFANLLAESPSAKMRLPSTKTTMKKAFAEKNVSKKLDMRIEDILPSADADPYIAIALTMGTVIHRLKKLDQQTKAYLEKYSDIGAALENVISTPKGPLGVCGKIPECSMAIPRDRIEALTAFDRNQALLTNIFGEPLYIAIKREYAVAQSSSPPISR